MPKKATPEGPDDPRAYVRIAIDLPFNPKLLAMSNPDAAIAGALIAICTAAKGLTDGHVSMELLRRSGVEPTLLKEMIVEDLWHEADHSCPRCDQPRPGHIYIHDYLRHQRSAAQIRGIKERKSRAGAAGAQKRWHSQTKAESAVVSAPVDPEPVVVVEPVVPEQTPVKAKPVQQEIAVVATETAPVVSNKKTVRPEVKSLCDGFAKLIQRNDSRNRAPSITAAWLDDMRKILDLDGFTFDQVKDVILWSQHHHFWWKNVKSPGKLREQLRVDRNDLYGIMLREKGIDVDDSPAGTAGRSRAGDALSVADRLDAKYAEQRQEISS